MKGTAKPRGAVAKPTAAATKVTKAAATMPAAKPVPRTASSPPAPVSSDELEKLRAENAQLLNALRSLEARCSLSCSCARSAASEEAGEGAEPAAEPAAAADEEQEALGEGDEAFTVVVLGASGDLAKKKIYPSLFRLKQNGWLPSKFSVVGYSRSHMTDEEFRARVCSHKDAENLSTFCPNNHYVSGNYDSVDDVRKLSAEIAKYEAQMGGKRSNRLFYMAVPPSIFVPTARALRQAAMSPTGWTRIVVEKPFGRDLESSRLMQRELGSLFAEDQIYRIDHYLGKEMVQNLNILRFSNVFLRPLWNHNYISSVVITFKEDIGTEGRAGYFDHYGIIRDIMQNHLLQIMALVAMETPVSLSSEDIRDEKVKVLRAVPPLSAKDVVVGQYDGYLTEPDVPADSVTPTFAVARLHVNNTRWAGVPFILRCGKALNERKAEIRIQFRDTANFLFPGALPNELVIRLQPNEAIYLKIMNKAPGMSHDLVQSELDLTLANRFTEAQAQLPDAYEHLIRDVIRGDHSLFVRSDELDVAWRIFTPMLHELEEGKKKPIQYPKGSRGPSEGYQMMVENGFRYTSSDYKWPNA
eukprot:m51a1_g1216 putative glucose-6-phosphate dehydrogenase (584) ;mRNA; f:488035-490231